MFKNTASQTITLFAFDLTTGAAKTGDAANITAYVAKDGGAVTVLGDTSATEKEATNAKGLYQFDLTQAETNADYLVFSAKSATANVVVVPDKIYTRADLSTVVASLATIAAYLDTEVATILAAVDTEVAAIKAKTDNLPSDPADASDIAASFAAISFPTANQNADALLDRVDAVETDITVRDLLKVLGAYAGGKLTGAATDSITLYNIGSGTIVRLAATGVTADGDRPNAPTITT